MRSPYDGLAAEGYDRRYRDRELVGRILGYFRAERRAMVMGVGRDRGRITARRGPAHRVVPHH